MSAIDDLLLYPLLTDGPPVCPRMFIAAHPRGFQGEYGMPDFSKFNLDVLTVDVRRRLPTTTTPTVPINATTGVPDERDLPRPR